MNILFELSINIYIIKIYHSTLYWLYQWNNTKKMLMYSKLTSVETCTGASSRRNVLTLECKCIPMKTTDLMQLHKPKHVLMTLRSRRCSCSLIGSTYPCSARLYIRLARVRTDLKSELHLRCCLRSFVIWLNSRYLVLMLMSRFS